MTNRIWEDSQPKLHSVKTFHDRSFSSLVHFPSDMFHREVKVEKRLYFEENTKARDYKLTRLLKIKTFSFESYTCPYTTEPEQPEKTKLIITHV